MDYNSLREKFKDFESMILKIDDNLNHNGIKIDVGSGIFGVDEMCTSIENYNKVARSPKLEEAKYFLERYSSEIKRETNMFSKDVKDFEQVFNDVLLNLRKSEEFEQSFNTLVERAGVKSFSELETFVKTSLQDKLRFETERANLLAKVSTLEDRFRMVSAVIGQQSVQQIVQQVSPMQSNVRVAENGMTSQEVSTQPQQSTSFDDGLPIETQWKKMLESLDRNAALFANAVRDSFALSASKYNTGERKNRPAVGSTVAQLLNLKTMGWCNTDEKDKERYKTKLLPMIEPLLDKLYPLKESEGSVKE